MTKYRIHVSLLLILTLSLSGCSRHSEEKAQGYIEGRYTYIATSVSGVLKQILVEKGTRVKAGQQLLTLELQPESDVYKAAAENLKQSIASRDAIAANLAYAKITYERYKVLVKKNAVQQAQLDNAQSIYNSTIAQLAQANANIASTEAALAQAKWTQSQKTLSAPVDAIVFDVFYRLGEYTEANKAIISLLAPRDNKVIFFIPEAHLGAIQLGDEVNVDCDGCKQQYPAKISFISPSAEYTPPVIYSETTSAKLIFRIEARFSDSDAYLMHPGQPVIVNYTQHD